MIQGIRIGKGGRLEDKVCHLEGESMHSMTTNDGIFYEKYEKFRSDYSHMTNITCQG